MVTNKTIICFDMDGTIADLYSVKNWLSMLRKENPLPYYKAVPLWDMQELNKVLNTLRSNGIEIRIITWLSKDSSESYKQATRTAKKEWLKKYNFPYDYFHGVRYGATKADSIRKITKGKTAILIDDNEKVRNGWTLGETIDPTKIDIIEYLKTLI